MPLGSHKRSPLLAALSENCEGTNTMKKYVLILVFLISAPTYSQTCLHEIRDDQSNGNIEEIRDFYDLNGDGISEKIAFVSGGPTSGLRYSVVYIKNGDGCYVDIGGGTENLALGSIPKAFNLNLNSTGDVFNGYKVLQDSNGVNQVMIYLYNTKSSMYVQAYTIVENEWVRN